MAGQNDNNTVNQYLPFEETVAQLDRQVVELKEQAQTKGLDFSAEIRQLQKAQTKELKRVYSSLNPWQTVQVARHPQRPLFTDYLDHMVKDVRELHGDRLFGDDRAIVTALGQIGHEKVMIVGQNKGRETKEKIECNFGCPNPEGYRKALLKMKFAEKYGLPIVTFIDTPGAYPGIGAEERGQAQAIALNLMEMSRLKVPIICIVIGEGGSGGALGIGVGDQIAILEYAYYSVISPEGCAAILWRDGSKANEAADALKLTSTDLKKLNLVDEVIKEPLGGAHRNVHDTIYNVEQYILKALRDCKRQKIDNLLDARYEKLRKLGNAFQTVAQSKSQEKELPDNLSVKKQLEQATKAQKQRMKA
ncbi:Acetyl-coenzyme A carboxylase carboxyl transferase subunit alpha [Anaerohalosphaera lusitana]|uniref:Acetyl-coenzyme A carboxylase carboxyl transferase subunit alpha n=1 Tax=Anaerohalosphaera lusitana TaxID=1936003 RepID=A0A1U9NMJ1_9BACT|nr:acetyl-CoA carboxylase carboxyltransferase subunit alpha [Anaerohalosphaera lusitana]AQT69017.1 Acetyl-coenzyme A carboxylase carboxyl transferase subunit alpha [Anaerohalosphaera lusitana]